ncbi:MAG TPA: hypothetical protein ACHBZ9_00225, partial [Arsenophonus nasoniae]|uniref:hypothetical protein n=1 Tax=Arsenophonus nasoniae TaxID=638 RepID=UPI00387911A1
NVFNLVLSISGNKLCVRPPFCCILFSNVNTKVNLIHIYLYGFYAVGIEGKMIPYCAIKLIKWNKSGGSITF